MRGRARVGKRAAGRLPLTLFGQALRGLAALDVALKRLGLAGGARFCWRRLGLHDAIRSSVPWIPPSMGAKTARAQPLSGGGRIAGGDIGPTRGALKAATHFWADRTQFAGSGHSGLRIRGGIGRRWTAVCNSPEDEANHCANRAKQSAVSCSSYGPVQTLSIGRDASVDHGRSPLNPG